MSNNKKVPGVKFLPGCFDNFDGTQEELDDLVKAITEMAESGELMENAIELTDELGNLIDLEERVTGSTSEEHKEIMSEVFDLLSNNSTRGSTLH